MVESIKIQSINKSIIGIQSINQSNDDVLILAFLPGKITLSQCLFILEYFYASLLLILISGSVSYLAAMVVWSQLSLTLECTPAG